MGVLLLSETSGVGRRGKGLEQVGSVEIRKLGIGYCTRACVRARQRDQERGEEMGEILLCVCE